MKHMIAAMMGVGLLVLVIAGAFWADRAGRLEQLEATANLRKELEHSLSSSSLLALGKTVTRKLYRQLRGCAPNDARIPRIVSEALKGLPAKGIQVMGLDCQEHLLWAGSPGSDTFAPVMKIFEIRWLRSKGIRTPRVRTARSLARPNLLPVLFFDEDIEPGKTAGVLVVFDVSCFDREFLSRVFLRKMQAKGLRVGAWNRLTEKGFGMPQGLTPQKFLPLFKRFLRRNEYFIKWGRENLVMVPSEGRLVLFGLVAPIEKKFPGGALGLMVLLVFFAWRRQKMGEGHFSLGSFLGLAVSIAAGIPLFLTLVFWFYFEQNRVETMTNDQFRTMEQHLVNIDNQVPGVLRTRGHLFRKLILRLEKEPENLPQLLDLISTLELTYRYFDIFFMVNAAGVNLRDFCLIEASFRRFLVVPREKRLKMLQMTIDQGYNPPRLAVEIVMELVLDPRQIHRFWQYKPSAELGKSVPEGVSVLGKMMIQRYNQMNARGAEDQAKDKSSLVYGAVIDSQTGDLIQRGLATLGNFIKVGSGEHSAYLFVDIIKDLTGLGKYFVMVFNDLRGIEHAFLGSLFRNREAWPEDLYFAAEPAFGYASFPERPKKHLLKTFFTRLVPPRGLFSERVTIGGRPMLLSGFACRNLPHYVLFAASPWEVIGRQEVLLQKKMAVLAGMMFLLLVGIFWRLQQGITLPAQALIAGVRAMEQKKFEHRIPLLTGDEWDEIALSFNNALGGMEELEVARIVQTQILPPGPVEGTCGRFVGRSIMTGQVGGDYYDAIVNEDGGLNFVIGDVTGHGVSAALVVAMAKSAFHIMHRMGVRSPAEMLNGMNRLIVTHLSKKKALSMQAGLVTADGKLLLANAGHPFPFLVAPGRRVERLIHPGFPLGTMARTKYAEKQIHLPGPRAMLVLYTDGIIEQLNQKAEAFGLNALEQAISEKVFPEPEPLITNVHHRLREFSGGKAWDDDVTLAVLSIHFGAPGPSAASGAGVSAEPNKGSPL